MVWYLILNLEIFSILVWFLVLKPKNIGFEVFGFKNQNSDQKPFFWVKVSGTKSLFAEKHNLVLANGKFIGCLFYLMAQGEV